MRKKTYLLFILILACLFVFTACDFNPSNSPNNNNDNNANEENSMQYQIYLMAQESGYEGTYELWLESIKGADGINGREIELSIVDENIVWRYVGTTEWNEIYSVNDLIGPQGLPGEAGKPGEKGEDGLDGISISNAVINQSGELILTFSDGKKINLGKVVGDDGKSAYELYVETHPEYTKTEAEWLDDLVNDRLGTVEETKYTVTFDSKGGSLVESQSITKLNKVKMPEDPIKEGYDFKGWYVQGEMWIFNGFLVTEDITLEAVWSPQIYDVIINYDNGESCTQTKMYYGDKLDLTTPTKPNNVFLGWVDDQGTIIDPNTYVVKNNVTITATWRDYIYIKYDVNGGLPLEDKKVTIGSTVEQLDEPTMDGGIFLGWYLNDTKVEFPFNCSYEDNITLVAHWKLLADDFTYDIVNGNEVRLLNYTGTMKDVEIPSTINGMNVSTIGTDVFKNNANIESIVMNKNITTIENGAFMNMSSLTNVEFGENVINYGTNLLLDCPIINSLTIRCNVGLLRLFDYNETNIPSSLINLKVYYDKSATIKAKLLNQISNHKFNLELIGNWPTIRRDEMWGLKLYNLKFPSTISRIETGALYATDLTSVVIPEGVEYIGYHAFCNAHSIAAVVIPRSMKTIEDGAFGCCDIIDVYYAGTKEEWFNIKFLGYNEELTKAPRIEFESQVKTLTNKRDTNFSYVENDRNEVILRYCDNKNITEVDLSNYFVGKILTAIGVRAIMECDNLKSIYIPESVEIIGTYGVFGNDKLVINCGAPSLPSKWDKDWNWKSQSINWNCKNPQ